MLGAIGRPLIFVSSIAVLFGAYEQNGLHLLSTRFRPDT
jgi:hypothetical protein